MKSIGDLPERNTGVSYNLLSPGQQIAPWAQPDGNRTWQKNEQVKRKQCSGLWSQHVTTYRIELNARQVIDGICCRRVSQCHLAEACVSIFEGPHSKATGTRP